MTSAAIALIVGRLYYFIEWRDCLQIPHITAGTSNYSYAMHNSDPVMAASFSREMKYLRPIFVFDFSLQGLHVVSLNPFC